METPQQSCSDNIIESNQKALGGSPTTFQPVMGTRLDEADHIERKLGQMCINDRGDAEAIRRKLRLWLNQILRIVITDGRIIVGSFVCTDRDANVILENSWEYSQTGSVTFNSEDQEPRLLGLTLIPGNHIVSVSIMASRSFFNEGDNRT